MPRFNRKCNGCGAEMSYDPEGRRFDIKKAAGKPLCAQCTAWQHSPREENRQ
jgi:hypothetical protein